MLTVLRPSQRSWKSECRVATGRSAVSHLINVTVPKAVLLPAYCPEGIIVPFQRAGVPIKFYKLRSDLRPNLEYLPKVMVKGAIVVVIHYFGWMTEVGSLREMVHDGQSILFEDCAHALFAKAPDADVALWSLNKFLPVVDGAILRSRRRDINVDLTPTRGLPTKTLTAYHEHLDLNARLAGITDFQHALDLSTESQIAYERYYHDISQDLTTYAQSHESQMIVAHSDLDEIKQVRSHNAASYHKIIPECFRFRDKAPVAPFAYPIVVKPPFNCDSVYESLLKVGVLASTLIEKWDQIPKGDARFEIEHTFMDEHLLLPVGEEVTYDDICKVGACLKDLVQCNGSRSLERQA